VFVFIGRCVQDLLRDSQSEPKSEWTEI